MRWTPEQLAEYQGRQGRQGRVEVPVSKETALPKKLQGETLRLVLPFKLPTWNQLLAMNHWQRAKVREWIKKQVSTCIQSGDVSQTPTGYQLKLSLTPLSLAEYSEMITPNASKKYRTAKRLAGKKKPLLR